MEGTKQQSKKATEKVRAAMCSSLRNASRKEQRQLQALTEEMPLWLKGLKIDSNKSWVLVGAWDMYVCGLVASRRPRARMYMSPLVPAWGMYMCGLVARLWP